MSLPTKTGDLTIRMLKTTDDYHQAEAVQRAAWSIQDDTEVVPLHVLLTAQKHGGLVLGAFDEAGEMVGFLFGFLGRAIDGRWKHCSHMMGIVPGQARRGVGGMLKRRQREFALNQGLDLITWTYDPLEGVNAMLNFGKLGVVCRTYIRNLYGDMADDLNQGLPSDRFEVEWWIPSRHVRERLQAGRKVYRLEALAESGAQVVNPTGLKEGLRLPGEANLQLDAPRLLVEAPADIQAIKNASMTLAQDWRLQTRTIFEAYFQAGYWAADFFSEQTGEERRNFYLLCRSVPGL
ncbi:MAG: hypothetical protein ACE5FD_12020 [Anaerolineae bacterium]